MLRDLEDQCVIELEEVAENYEEKKYLDDLQDLFKEGVETEMKYYTKFNE